MKTILLIISILLISSTLQAQQNYFAYIQTDNKQPFYVKMNDKMLSSSGVGYVVIPKLLTGNYNLTIGFAKDLWPQQSLLMIIAKQDVGYILKNFGEKGWGLYNMQTMEIIMNGASNAIKPIATANTEDIFTNTLSAAANTTLSTNKPAVIPTVEPAKIVAIEPIKSVENKQEVEIFNDNNSFKITQIKSYNDRDGKSITYTNQMNNRIDTINIFIPVEKKVAVVEIPAKVVPQSTPTNEQIKEQKFLDIDMQNPAVKTSATPEKVLQNASIESAKETTAVKKTTNKPVVNFNSDCKAIAGEEDFLKIRKKMAASASDDAMVSVAQKFFKSTCFSVEQVKNLCILFLNDGGKYKFFDAAYPHVHDSQNYAELQNQLTDIYYINRFKAMMHN